MKLNKSLLKLTIACSLLISCGPNTSTDILTPKEQRDKRINPQGSFLTGKSRTGIRLDDVFEQKDDNLGSYPLNALLWRASLDTLSVIPLASVDTFGGTIISEWYAHPEDRSLRIKVAIFVLDRELRADGIRVEVYAQKRVQETLEWEDAGRDEGLATRLEDLILTRAREIRSSNIGETN